MMTELQRAFECWFECSYSGVNMETDNRGAYTNSTTQLAWACFKGGRAYIPSARDVAAGRQL